MSSQNSTNHTAQNLWSDIDFSDLREKIEQAEYEKQMKDDKPEQEDFK